MARRRLGVVLVLDPPLADEVDGLRRALGDRALGRIAPHVTLISPINVRADDLPAVLGLLRDAAAQAPGPLTLELGPPATFLPANPVLHLPVGGTGLGPLERMRRVLFAGPLARPLTWPWVPHVTLVDGADDDVVATAAGVLGGFRLSATCDRVVLLEERVAAAGSPEPRRRWEALADVTLGPRAVVGRGGLQVEMTTGRVPDPEAEALTAGLGTPEPWGAPLVCTARQDGRVVGAGAVRWQAGGAVIEVAVDRSARDLGVEGHLRARLRSVLAEAGWEGPVVG
jgi:2'-5' RNA ligase